jgi:hypothetical protein
LGQFFQYYKALKNVYHHSNQGQRIFFSKGSVSVTFDRVTRRTNDSVSGIVLLVNESSVVNQTNSGNFYGKKVHMNEFHKILGHCRSDRLEKTAKIHNLKLNGGNHNDPKDREKCWMKIKKEFEWYG